jgi:haloalkane dehalogenase
MQKPLPPPWVDRTAYPFASKTVDLPDGRMHYVDEGAGDPWLLVHGTPTWSFEYRHVIKAMRATVRVIAPDLLGFGLSERPPGFSYTPEDHNRALTAFVDRLGLSRFTLVAHDFGGPIAIPLALDGRATRLVIMNTFMWPVDVDPRMARGARLLGGALGRWLYRNANVSLRVLMPSVYGNRARLTPEIRRHYLEPFKNRNDRVLVLHRLARALLESAGYYRQLEARAADLRRMPMLIIWGMKDSAFGARHLGRWQALAPHARVERLADAGHWPHEEVPDRVAALLLDFHRHQQA